MEPGPGSAGWAGGIWQIPGERHLLPGMSAASTDTVPLNTSRCCTGLGVDQGLCEAQVFLTELWSHRLRAVLGDSLASLRSGVGRT